MAKYAYPKWRCEHVDIKKHGTSLDVDKAWVKCNRLIRNKGYKNPSIFRIGWDGSDEDGYTAYWYFFRRETKKEKAERIKWEAGQAERNKNFTPKPFVNPGLYDLITENPRYKATIKSVPAPEKVDTRKLKRAVDKVKKSAMQRIGKAIYGS